MALLGLLGLGLSQVGCAHPVVVEPSVSVHSQIGHFPAYAQVGALGPVIYAPPPRVIYAPPSPPRGFYVPRVLAPAAIWGHRHDRHFRRHERKQERDHDRGRGQGGGPRDDWRR